MGTAIFWDVQFKGCAKFTGSHFSNYSGFDGAYFDGYAYFDKSQFDKCASFIRTRYKYYADFSKSNFGSKAIFERSRFGGNGVTFKNAKFGDLKSQDEICRMTKIVLEKLGDKEEAGHCFYREMEAKRRLNGITKHGHELDLVTYPITNNQLATGHFNYRLTLAPTSKQNMLLLLAAELKNHKWSKIFSFLRYNLAEYIIFQKLFGGYGVYPLQIILWWAFITIVLGFIYWPCQGINGATCLQQNIDFSFSVAFTRDYGEYYPKTAFFKTLVKFEIIFGLVMFGAFLASITRKYMR